MIINHVAALAAIFWVGKYVVITLYANPIQIFQPEYNFLTNYVFFFTLNAALSFPQSFDLFSSTTDQKKLRTVTSLCVFEWNDLRIPLNKCVAYL